MLDGINARKHGASHALSTVGVSGNLEAIVFSGLHDGGNFSLGELGVLTALCLAEHTAGRRQLDQVGALFVALPHRLPRVLHAVDHAFGRSRVTPQACLHAIRGVGVATRRCQRFSGRIDGRARK